jgi:RHS repeat-associated protein
MNGSYTPLPLNAWGTPHSAVSNFCLFTGREYDEESGLYDYRARSYHPLLGRFLQRDPIQIGDNLYRYVDDTPTAKVDPSGLLLIAVDGTGSRAWAADPNFRTAGGMAKSHVANFYTDYRGTKAYWHGPDSSVSETIVGGEAAPIHRGVYAWLTTQWCRTKEPIDMVGHSRGGHIVLQVANDLNTIGITCGCATYKPVPIRFLGLYDPVDMSAGYGGNYNVPGNVQTAVVELADPNLGSRSSWTRAYTGSSATRTYFRYIRGTHAAIGGAPFTGDLTGRNDASFNQMVDNNAAREADSFMRFRARAAGVPINVKPWRAYDY